MNKPLPSLSKRFVPHSLLEDALAIVTGTLFVSLGIAFFNQAGLLTGGTAGLAFLLHYRTGIAFGTIFFLINLPFYWLAWKRMGWKFTLKTFCSVALVSVLSGYHSHFLQLINVTLWAPFYITDRWSADGCWLCGAIPTSGKSGGINILALYLQQTRGIRAGKLQMGLDITIVLASLTVVTPMALAASILGAFALNLAISLNHRPGRYMSA